MRLSKCNLGFSGTRGNRILQGVRCHVAIKGRRDLLAAQVRRGGLEHTGNSQRPPLSDGHVGASPGPGPAVCLCHQGPHSQPRVPQFPRGPHFTDQKTEASGARRHWQRPSSQ